MPNIVRIDRDLLSSSKIKSAYAWTKAGAKVLALLGVDANGRCTCGKSKCKSPGKHPLAAEFPKGQHSATSQKLKISRIFKKYPNANLGVVLPKNIVVSDVDGPEGKATFDKLNLPKTATVQTGRGTHHYFRVDKILPAKKRKLVGIDIKDGESGYIVAPPSKHHSGKRYIWKRTAKYPTKIETLPTKFIEDLKV